MSGRIAGRVIAVMVGVLLMASLVPATALAATAPAITSANSTTFTVGVPGSFTVTTTGTSPITISESGTLPSGVTFTDNADGTATLAGTPAAMSNGTYALTITAANGTLPDATQNFTLTVNPPTAPHITSASGTIFTVGAAGSFTVTTTGIPTPSISQSGALPSGVTFHDNGNGTATLAGTPAASTNGSYALAISATNVGGTANQGFTLTVNSADGAWDRQRLQRDVHGRRRRVVHRDDDRDPGAGHQ